MLIRISHRNQMQGPLSEQKFPPVKMPRSMTRKALMLAPKPPGNVSDCCTSAISWETACGLGRLEDGEIFLGFAGSCGRGPKARADSKRTRIDPEREWQNSGVPRSPFHDRANAAPTCPDFCPSYDPLAAGEGLHNKAGHDDWDGSASMPPGVTTWRALLRYRQAV